ncbi:MAG TPA: low affinity iron permease family protein [Terriglobales bacterium]
MKQNEHGAGFRVLFGRGAAEAAQVLGSPLAFTTAVAAVLAWALLGRYYHYSDTWQLVINTGTTIVTFLSVFLIQNTQNRDARAIHLKLDEIIRAIAGADNRIIDAEHLSDEELLHWMKAYERLHREYERRGKVRQQPRKA